MSYRLVGDFLKYTPHIGVLFLASWLGQREDFLVHSQIAASLPILPYLIGIVGAVIAWNFKMSTSVMGFWWLMLVFWTISTLLPYGYTDDAFGNILYAGLTILTPLTMAWLCWADERGILTRSGLIRLGFITGQLLLLFLFTYLIEGGLQQFAGDFLTLKLVGAYWSDWSKLPQWALGAYTLATGVIILRFIIQRSPVQVGWFLALFASYLSFEEAGNLDQVSLYMTITIMLLALAKIQMSYQMAFVDELTGISGRRALMAELKKLGNKYVIAMCDIDHFKSFNDTYGHDIGDEVLRMVARKLEMVSGGGRAYRYGGEEFTIVFPIEDAAKALPFLERVRESIENAPFIIRGDQRPDKDKMGEKLRGQVEHATTSDSDVVSVTISMGVCARADHHETAADVMKEADEALYRAKDNGRNQVSL